MEDWNEEKTLLHPVVTCLEWFVFQPVSWPNTGILIAENGEISVRIAAIFVLIQGTFDRIDATCGQMLASVNEIFSS